MGMAWYTPESWRELQAVAEGPLCGSYGEFVAYATEQVRAFEARGIKVDKYPVDVAHMAAWCKRHGYRLNSKGRSIYGAALLAAGRDRAKLDKTPFEGLP
jgi:hypothetical protein